MKAAALRPAGWGARATPPRGERELRGPGRLRTWLRPHLTLLTLFWIYVALSNVLYASSMQASMISMNVPQHIYASWDARLLQHAMLYPVLLGCVWAALRLGWQPRLRALPLQLLLGLVFCILAGPALWLAETLVKDSAMTHGAWSMGHKSMYDWYVWTASATSFLLTYGFALALVSGFEFYRRLRDEQLRVAALERALSAAQLASLRMQLSPHTLFNLLHTIRGHIAWDPAAAQAMVVQLGDLLRMLLAAGRREFTPLWEELQFARLYLGLQQRRFSDRLTVQVPAADSVPAAWVPSLILQPLIENAVVHGLAGEDGPVVIRVEALATDETLLLRVSNTMGASPKAGGAGIGLANVRERLAIQLGSRASLHAAAAPGHVWVAEVRLPLLREGAAAAGVGSSGVGSSPVAA
jgi:hypothetical protein